MPVSIRAHVTYPPHAPTPPVIEKPSGRGCVTRDTDESNLFRRRIMRRLIKRGWTLREVGAPWGISPSAVSLRMNGRPE